MNFHCGNSNQMISGNRPELLQTELAYLYQDYRCASKSRFSKLLDLKLLSLFEPMIVRAMEHIAEQLESVNHEHIFSLDKGIGLFLPILYTRLSAVAGRTLVLEMHVAKHKGLLVGVTPEQRYQSFVQLLKTNDYATSLFGEYPCLVRYAKAAVDNWQVFCCEFLGRLSCDHSALEQKFFQGKELGRLKKLGNAEGDSHNSGRMVISAQFSSGQSIVYKPRDLKVDSAYSDLLQWLNNNGQSPKLKSARVLNRAGYGWCEFIQSKPCKNEQQVKDYFLSFGGLVALSYCCRASDLHFENLIAAGSEPVLIDLETFLKPCLFKWDSSVNLLSSGLLPDTKLTASEFASDISALARSGKSVTQVPSWEKVGTDEMSLSFKSQSVDSGKHRVYLGEEPVSPCRYMAEIIKGFNQTYQLLLNNKSVLLADDSILSGFKHSRVRYLLRNTQYYAKLLSNLYYPENLTNLGAQKSVLRHLELDYLEFPQLSPLISKEKAALIQGDIPLFETSAAMDITALENSGPILNNSGYQHLLFGVQALSEQDRKKQLSVLRNVFLAMEGTEPEKLQKTLIHKELNTESSRQRYLAMACEIGDHLSDIALDSGFGKYWLGFKNQNRKWSYGALTQDLYEGQLGIVLFLAYLADISADHKYKKLAVEGLQHFESLHSHSLRYFPNPGAFSGLGAVIYVMSHLQKLWRDDSSLAILQKSCSNLIEKVEGDRAFDLIAGTSGGLLALLSAYAVTADTQYLEWAKYSAEHLLRHAQVQGAGMFWQSDYENNALTGLSHGSAGIAQALARLSKVANDSRYLHAAMEAAQYENELYSSENNNWPDLRTSICSEGRYKSNAWCHGAAGISLSRLALLELLPTADKSRYEQDCSRAFTGIFEQGFNYNHSLCHGSLGNLIVAFDIAKYQQNTESQQRVFTELNSILSGVEQVEQWRCGFTLNAQSPGFMTGLSGMGWALLYFYRHGEIPSILSLQSA